MVLSAIFITLVPRIFAVKQLALGHKTQVLRSIEQSNREKLNLYDFY
jgi:hypothetical protein